MSEDWTMRASDAAKKATVLLVEPKASVRVSMAASLTEAGFMVLEAEGPDEVWSTLEERSDIRVVLADLDLPQGTEGLELAWRIHERWPSLGLVITSEHIRHLPPADIPGDGCFVPRPLPVETLWHEVSAAAQR
jgi:DNA-binding NtrC family response regulator